MLALIALAVIFFATFVCSIYATIALQYSHGKTGATGPPGTTTEIDYLSAYVASAYTTDTEGELSFDAVSTSKGITTNNMGNIFTIAKDGTYNVEFGLSVEGDPIGDDGELTFNVTINDVVQPVIRARETVTGGVSKPVTASGLIELSAGDEVSLIYGVIVGNSYLEVWHGSSFTITQVA
jgi:hypothetical protein